MQLRIINPATLAVLAEVPGSESGDIARALAELSSRESGQPLCESLDAVRAAADGIEACAARGSRGRTSAPGAPGTLALLAAFGGVLPELAAGLAAALVAGRCVIYKPAPQNSLAALAAAEFFSSLPSGVAVLLTGGTEVDTALAAHSGVEIVRLGEPAADRAHIVLADADLELAVPAIAWQRLRGGGQGRAPAHLYVERSILPEFVDRMHPCVGFLDVDDPVKSSTDLGPLHSSQAATTVEDQVGRTLREGARLILGGRRFRPSGLPGHFFQPTILSDVRPGGVPAREAIAGPVITITPVAGLGEALGLWRACPGSGRAQASIYTGAAAAAVRALDSQEHGLFRINDPEVAGLGPFADLGVSSLRLALGGGATAASGGRAVEVASVVERKPWWFPYAERRT